MLTTSKKILNQFVLSTLIVIGSAQSAEELGRINFTLKGEIVAYSCGIDIDSINKFVNLGRWSNAQIVYRGHGYTSYIPFEIHLNDCPPNWPIMFQFNGTKDAIDAELLAIENKASSAKNVAIEIADNNGQRLPLGKRIVVLTSDNNGNGVAKFKARYRATQVDPTVGSANADAIFVVTYE